MREKQRFSPAFALALGAVVLAMDLMGIVKAENFTAAPGRILRPDPKNAEIYRKKFQRYLSYYRMEA